MRRLFTLARPYRTALWLSIILALAGQVFDLAVPWLTGGLIDTAIQPRNLHRLEVYIALILGAAVLQLIFMYARRMVAGRMAVDIEYDLRNRVYAHLQRLSFGFFDHHQTGQLMSRATADVGAVRIFLAYGVLFFTQYLFTITGVLILLVLTDPVLALVAIAIVPFLAVSALRYSRRSHPILTAAQQTLADVTTQAEENVVGVRIVKAFGQEQRETGRFRDRAETVFTANIAATRLRAFYTPLMGLIPGLAVAAVLLVGGERVINGAMTIGEFVRFNLLLALLVMPLRMVGMWVGQAQRAVASGVRVFEILDLDRDISSPTTPVTINEPRGAISLEAVTFGYDRDRPVLHDITLSIAPGSTVALIGPTGCGKTTLASLVPRFYDATEGHVRVDDVDVRDLDLAALRCRIGIVAEDTFLFSSSVRDNIAFGAPWATDRDVRKAASRAQAAEFIESLPDGYATMIGERGLTLSGGQRQRLAIARALLLDPEILILDDATASVDATTETKIKLALREVMQGRTTIIIAHRLSTIALADRVVVLEAGRIVADGDHDTLAETSATYRRIREHGLVDRAFIDFDGDRYVPPKDGDTTIVAASPTPSRLA
jgi:ABC-type multidrug transport system fused ATPase/permease subunit